MSDLDGKIAATRLNSQAWPSSIVFIALHSFELIISQDV